MPSETSKRAAKIMEAAIAECAHLFNEEDDSPDGVLTGFVVSYCQDTGSEDRTVYGYLSMNASQPPHVSAGLLEMARRYVMTDDEDE